MNTFVVGGFLHRGAEFGRGRTWEVALSDVRQTTAATAVVGGHTGNGQAASVALCRTEMVLRVKGPFDRKTEYERDMKNETRKDGGFFGAFAVRDANPFLTKAAFGDLGLEFYSLNCLELFSPSSSALGSRKVVPSHRSIHTLSRPPLVMLFQPPKIADQPFPDVPAAHCTYNLFPKSLCASIPQRSLLIIQLGKSF